MLFSKSQPIHVIFEATQKALNVDILSVKRINTVRWNSREFSLDLFLEQYGATLDALEQISTSRSFDADKRCIADCLLNAFVSKQFIATSILFREIFEMTGPLSRTLQSVDIDFGKAGNTLDSASEQLSSLREQPRKIIDSVVQNFEGVKWEEKRVIRRKRMPDENASDDEPPASPEEMWRRGVFYVSIDCVVQGLKNHLKESRKFLEAFAVFSPKCFSKFSVAFPTSRHVRKSRDVL